MDDKIRTKTMLSIPNPASGPPRIVGPPELVIAERDQLRDALDAARARIAELEAAGRELVDTIDRADYGDASRAINHAADDFRAVLDASSAVRQADASRED